MKKLAVGKMQLAKKTIANCILPTCMFTSSKHQITEIFRKPDFLRYN